jgi:hypothetical protein
VHVAALVTVALKSAHVTTESIVSAVLVMIGSRGEF